MHKIDCFFLIFFINYCFGFFFISTYNVIMTFVLVMDWGLPLKLVIGWGGVSLTPILVSPPKAEPNPIFLIPIILFIYYSLCFRFFLYPWYCDLRRGNTSLSNVFNVLVIRFFGAFISWITLYPLFNDPMEGWPIEFKLGVEG